MSMKTNLAGLNLIKSFEGCRLTAYKCPAGIWTIGYGHTGDVSEGMKITQAQADELLKKDLAKFEKKVAKYDSKYHWNQNQFDAMVSFAFNIGSIDQLTAKGTRSIEQIAEKITAYNKAGGKVLTGLTRRRKAEKELFCKPVSAANEAVNETVTNHDGYSVKVIAKSGLNVRKGPDIGCPKIGVLKKNDIVKVLRENSGWGRIETGWICLKYTTKI